MPANRLFLSPHLDDAALSCGELIASSSQPVVATLFAGRPSGASTVTDWDARCGYAVGDDVVGARREEDRFALDALAARPLWLDFVDDQYGESPPIAELCGALDALIERERPDAVYLPLGLFHADHVRTSDGALALVTRHADVRWFAYEDALYRSIGGLVAKRRAELRRNRIALRRSRFEIDDDAPARKRAALACYVSQLRGLGTRSGYDDALEPEVFWRIAPGKPT